MGDDAAFVDLGVVVHQDVTEPHRSGQRGSQVGVGQAGADQWPEGVGVRCRHAKALVGHHVVGGVDAGLDGGQEGVLEVAQSDRVGQQEVGVRPAYPSRMASRAVIRPNTASSRSASTMGRHEVPSEPVAAEGLVEVALAGVGLPADPPRGIIVEHHDTGHRHPTRQAVRRAGEVEEVDHFTQRAPEPPVVDWSGGPYGKVDIGALVRVARRVAAEHQRETHAAVAQRATQGLDVDR